MNYGNYFVDSENVMTLEDIIEYSKNKDSAYILIKKKNKEDEEIFFLKKIVILNIHEKENLFDNSSEMRLSFITLDDELHKHVSLSDMGKNYILLKLKPGEEYIKVSVSNMVAQGKYCKDCKYWSNKKLFSDEYGKCHDACCLLFLTYLDGDREIGELLKCEQCKKLTGY